MLYTNLWLKEHSIFKNAIEQISETLLLVVKCALDTPKMLQKIFSVTNNKTWRTFHLISCSIDSTKGKTCIYILYIFYYIFITYIILNLLYKYILYIYYSLKVYSLYFTFIISLHEKSCRWEKILSWKHEAFLTVSGVFFQVQHDKLSVLSLKICSCFPKRKHSNMLA